MNMRAAGAQVRRSPFRWAGAAVICACFPLIAAQAQDASDSGSDEAESIDEIVVAVDRAGRRVDIDARRNAEILRKVIQEFELERHKQAEESWRLRLRSVMQRKTSRFAWGYDAQAEAARFRYTNANYLPIDRVTPVTMVSIRF